MLIEELAQVCHEVNKAYCEALGDSSQPTWEDAPDWQKQSAIDGVIFHKNNLKAGPEASHENWLALKLSQGWKVGSIKNEKLKIHPCCVPYNKLPVEQRAKDYIFRQIVHSLKEMLA